MRKFFRNLSPQSRFVIAETARVCACVGIIVFATEAITSVASKVLQQPIE